MSISSDHYNLLTVPSAQSTDTKNKSGGTTISEPNGLCPVDKKSHSANFSGKRFTQIPNYMRKTSLPATQLSQSNLTANYLDKPGSPNQIFDRRRLSAVSIAITQRLQNSITWNLIKPPLDHTMIVEKGRMLFERYFCLKLRKSGISNKRICISRHRSLANTSLDPTMASIASELTLLIQEIENAHPGVYDSVIRHTSSFILNSSKLACSALNVIAREIFRNEINWVRVAAFFSIAGAFAVDCVKAGKAEYINALIDTVASFIDRDLTSWIIQQGGWVS